jgi:uncharacterized protein YyaL (SSP411 family)
MTANSDLEEKAVRIGRAFSNTVKQFPAVYTQLMVALDFGIGPSYEVVIVGNPKSEDTKAMIQTLRKHFIPNKVVLLRTTDKEAADISGITEFTKNHISLNGKATAYICINYECKLPTTDTDKMLELLGVKKSKENKAS